MSESGQQDVDEAANGWNQQIIDEFRANEGRVGGPFEGANMIIIHHVGAKSGVERETPLVHFPEDDHKTVLAASNAGRPKNPAWYHNLKATPRIEVEVGTQKYSMVSEEITGAERDEFWKRVVSDMPGFADYQKSTDRTIPLVRLTRVA
jgi:deazaflavin-dependent oxidoreductase (nitroreductase family)